MKNILFVHQSAEMYGSDKTLLYLVSELKTNGYFPIVVLPSIGPLYEELHAAQIQIIIAPVIKMSRKMFAIGNLISLPFQVIKSLSILKKELGKTKIDLVHSNTLAVLTGAFFARIYGIKHLWHVHEIITNPKIISNLYPRIVYWLSDIVVFNSSASKDFMVYKFPKIDKKSTVILNGFDRKTALNSDEEIAFFRKNILKSNSDDFIIALIGRINRWKGHHLLVDAFSEINKKHPKTKLVFVGSAPPNQENFSDSLTQKINELNLDDKVVILPFQNNIWQVWDSIDIAVVPSTEPEPFGLVAIEAMLASKPVVGSNHGGLLEIIEQDQTGLFFENNNKQQLSTAICQLIDNPEKRINLGKNGKTRAEKHFSLKEYLDNFQKIYQQ